MGFTKAVITVYARMFNFSGRARRAEYWWFFLFQVLLGIGAQVAVVVTFWDDPAFLAAITRLEGLEAWLLRNPQMVQYLGIFTIAWILLLALPNLSVSIRRLHDTDHSGWMILMPTLVGMISGFLGGIVAGAGAASGSGGMVVFSLVLMIVPVLIASIWLLVLMLLPGSHGPNRFGPDSIPNRRPPTPSHPAFARESADPEERAALAAARRAEAREYYRKHVLPQVNKAT